MGGSIGESCYEDNESGSSSDGAAESCQSEEDKINGMLRSNCSSELNLIIEEMGNEEGAPKLNCI